MSSKAKQMVNVLYRIEWEWQMYVYLYEYVVKKNVKRAYYAWYISPF